MLKTESLPQRELTAPINLSGRFGALSHLLLPCVALALRWLTFGVRAFIACELSRYPGYPLGRKKAIIPIVWDLLRSLLGSVFRARFQAKTSQSGNCYFLFVEAL
jgi:hypothetical protein